jgi:hypothetical protein
VKGCSTFQRCMQRYSSSVRWGAGHAYENTSSSSSSSSGAASIVKEVARFARGMTPGLVAIQLSTLQQHMLQLPQPAASLEAHTAAGTPASSWCKVWLTSLVHMQPLPLPSDQGAHSLQG